MAPHAAMVVASNYLPHARVFAASLSEHHPGLPLSVLTVDGLDGAPPARELHVLGPQDVGIAPRELHRRRMLFDTQG
jgi:hypothetical protein